MNWYKWLYTHIGGRPWTYILRDVWNEAEWLLQLIWFGLGAVSVAYLGWKVTALLWAVYTFGYLNGHLFWGTKWIRGQKGDTHGAR